MTFTLPSGKTYFTQWDSGTIVVPDSAPDNPEFYIDYYGNADGEDDRLVYDDEGIHIPDVVFQKSGRIVLICRVVVDDEEWTYYRKAYDVRPLDKPSDYIADDTDFAEYIEKVKEYIDEHGSSSGAYVDGTTLVFTSGAYVDGTELVIS